MHENKHNIKHSSNLKFLIVQLGQLTGITTVLLWYNQVGSTHAGVQ